MSMITEKTLIPISLVITIIGSTIAVTIAVSDGRAQITRLDKVEAKQDAMEKDVIDTQKRMILELTEIKTTLKYIKNK